MTVTTTNIDFLVIGGGSGGLACARRASAMYGTKAMVVEVKRLGGTCVNVGCVPKKLTWHAASIHETMIHDAQQFGFNIDGKIAFNWTAFKAKRDSLIQRLNDIHEINLSRDNVKYLHGLAQFVDQQTVRITLDGNQMDLKPKNILIAVGGYPLLPLIEGAEHGITSDGFFELETQPAKVAIVGAGYIAVELAGLFNALGTETHMFMRHDKFLRTFDPMIQETLAHEYKRQGISLHPDCNPSKLENTDNGQKTMFYKTSTGETRSATFDHVIWAIGRTPELSRLDLNHTAVALNDKGKIKVDIYQNTNVPHIYAIGDVCDSGFELTPVAIAAGRRLADRLFGSKDVKLDYTNIPSVVFSHPETGTIGLTEPQACKQYGSAKVYTTSFTNLYYSIMDEASKGRTSYKIVCVGAEEKVVGLHIVGHGSSEILQGFSVAIKMGATKADFDRCVAIHPTNAEELVTMK